MSKKSLLEIKLQHQISDVGLPKPDLEFEFCDNRKWRFDFAWYEIMLAVEVEGGTWSDGRHARPKGFESDCEKYNDAVLKGWSLLRVTSTMINDGRAIKIIEKTYDNLRSIFMSDDNI